MKRIAVLGSTGSIGTQALEVLRTQAASYKVVALAAHSNKPLLAAQTEEFRAQANCLVGASAHGQRTSPGGRREYTSMQGLLEMLADHPVDIVINAISGAAGLSASLRTLELGADLALANKESMVVAGQLLASKARETGASIIPIDSEHSALLQCFRAGSLSEVRRVHLTASGGPFRGRRRAELAHVSVEQAIRHPTWKMGKKISVDSATLMNKGLEIIEAHHLFGLAPALIEVVVHPQSIIHSIVEYQDGSLIAQLGFPDMRIPIQYALSLPARWPRQDEGFSLVTLGSFTFQAVDHETFPSIRLAQQACAAGGSAPAALNAANEAAVQLFLEQRIPFLNIFSLVEKALSEHISEEITSLQQVLEIDRSTREKISAWIPS